MTLPPRRLSQQEVEERWSRDRASLVACKDSKAGVVSYYERRDGALQ